MTNYIAATCTLMQGETSDLNYSRLNNLCSGSGVYSYVALLFHVQPPSEPLPKCD